MTDKSETMPMHLGDILSITTGRLVSPDHIDGVYRIVDYMTGVPHFTHQLPRGADACKPYLLEQYPWLNDVEVPESFDGKESVVSWLATVVAEHGEYHDVRRLPLGAYVGRDPLAEMVEMVGPERVIVVQLSSDKDPDLDATAW